MSNVQNIQQKTHNRFLNYYELEAVHRDGSISPYYMTSRAKDASQLKAVTHQNRPDGVILYGVYGEEKDRVVLIRQYRYPLGDYVYEFPAGLVEEGEEMGAAGVREMYEETGVRTDIIPFLLPRLRHMTSSSPTDRGQATYIR